MAPRLPPAGSLACVVALTALAAGCDRPQAYGDPNSIIVATDAELWTSIEDTVRTVMEPRIFTVREELAYKLTYQDPAEELWGTLRQWKQVLVIGEAGDPWMEEPLAEYRGDLPERRPVLLQAGNVWANNQAVTMVLLPEGGGASDVLSLADSLHATLDRQYRRFIRNRMYVTGRDTALADSLARAGGFRMVFPEVYYWDRRDSVFIFRNDFPSPSELIRQLLVVSRPRDGREHTTEEVLAWRDEISRGYYEPSQVVDTGRVRSSTVAWDGVEAIQVQGVWLNPPDADWPAAGPFYTRAVECPDQGRTFLVDAWLYAPGEDKYQYVIQLETLLDTFRCAGG